MKIVNNEEYLSQKEVGEILGYCQRHFNRLVRRGDYKLPKPLRIGKRDFYPKSQIKPHKRKRSPKNA